MTRTNRPLWMAAELGLEVKNVSLVLFDPEVDALNPNRKQPILVDEDGTTVYESLAINLYLLHKYGHGSDIAAKTAEEQGLILQWSMWAMTELDMRLFEAMMHTDSLEKAGHPVANDAMYEQYFGRPRTPARYQRLVRELHWPLEALDAALTARAWLASDGRFTAADLNVSVVLSWVKFLGPEVLAPFPALAAWLVRCR